MFWISRDKIKNAAYWLSSGDKPSFSTKKRKLLPAGVWFIPHGYSTIFLKKWSIDDWPFDWTLEPGECFEVTIEPLVRDCDFYKQRN